MMSAAALVAAPSSARAVYSEDLGRNPATMPWQEPPAAAVESARRAFEAFDARELRRADDLFSDAVAAWRLLVRARERPAAELSALLVARANVRVDSSAFPAALGDLDEARSGPLPRVSRVLRSCVSCACGRAAVAFSRAGLTWMLLDMPLQAIGIMATDAAGVSNVRADGTARFREYPDAFVQRGLAREGLKQWDAAIADYDAAITLWGGSVTLTPQALADAARSNAPLTINPFCLVYRGNAKAAKGAYSEALADFREAEVCGPPRNSLLRIPRCPAPLLSPHPTRPPCAA